MPAKLPANLPAKLPAEKESALPQSVLGDFPGIENFEVVRTEAGIRLKPLRPLETGKIDRIRKKIAASGITESEVRDAVEWARRRAE